MSEVDLSVNIGGIRMNNPVMPASGTFDCREEYSQLIDPNKLGAIVTKGTTLKPRAGNPQPRMCETPAGMINCIGLQNLGVEVVIKKKLSFLRQFEPPVIVNIAGGTIREYEELARRLDQVKEVDGLEINISCPNVEKGGMAFGVNPQITAEVVRRVRKATTLPLIVKLTPNVTDIVAIARSAVENGANALSLINTLKARARIRPQLGKKAKAEGEEKPKGPHAGKWIEGGLSGPAIRPIALRMVSEVAQANLGVEIIGMGGIMDIEDALDFFRAGANAIAIGTATFVNPKTMEEIIDGLRKYLVKHKIKDINSLAGELKGGLSGGAER